MLILLLLALALGLLYVGRPLLAWTVPGLVGLGWWFFAGEPGVGFWLVAVPFAAAFVVLGLPGVRRKVVTPHALRAVKPILPVMSETEKIALDAGTVWWDRDLFSGKPDWKGLFDYPIQELTPREREFIDGPVEELCRMCDDWSIVQDGDLPEEVWRFIREKGFLGMIIPESYGGLGFSAAAHSAVVTKLSTRSVTASVTVMVPNSLGPAELLLHYGTDEQKNDLLPKLARAEEIPCFALTEPGAGSDAASISSDGVVCKGQWNGEEVLGIRLNWDKRYITLAPIATLLGLAFRLRDPDGLLGGKEDVGITCALVPAHLEGVTTGERHDPMGVPFMNGTTQGKDVFVPIDAIIGGKKMAGSGWMMLMQSLAAGRGLSIPGLSTGASQLTTRTVGAYANVRKQFNLAIGRFEGIEEAVARIGGLTYMLNGARRLTHGAIDAGEKPSVVTAILKAYSTETMRGIVNDGMDVVAGAGISRGPRNVLATPYMSVPIGVTVEGANILTRSMIVFGQGAIRCHPHVVPELEAAAADDAGRFDGPFFGHIGFVFTNAVRSVVLGLTDGAVERTGGAGPLADVTGRMTRMSAAFAFVSDVAMGTLGGKLKFKETLTGRLSDALSWMYLGSATLKHFVDAGRPKEMEPFARWACENALFEVQQALRGFYDNFPIRPLAWMLKLVTFPLGYRYRRPSDRLGSKVARAVLTDEAVRASLTPDVFLPEAAEPGLGLLEEAFAKVRKADTVEKTIKEAVKQGRLERKPAATLLDRALEAGVVSEGEHRFVLEAEEARRQAVAVDAFPLEGPRSKRTGRTDASAEPAPRAEHRSPSDVV